MKGLKWLSALTFIFGMIFIIFGWVQSWDFSTHSSEFETVLLIRTVRTYVFIIGGVIMLTIGISLQFVKEYLRGLEIKLYDQKQK